MAEQIAALYVEEAGPYAGLPGVDLWGVTRDARLYPGPWPVVAHPPCERWGRYWGGGPMLHGTSQQKTLGDDGGCFASALSAVRRWGGVLEHPEASHAWRAFGLLPPPRVGGWLAAGDFIGWTCCVEQGHYGHRARKATWLYAARVSTLPSLVWGPSASDPALEIDPGYHSSSERWDARRVQKLGTISRMSYAERKATPAPFRDVLISIARSVVTNG